MVNPAIDEILYGNMTAQEAMDMVAQQVQDSGLEIRLRDKY